MPKVVTKLVTTKPIFVGSANFNSMFSSPMMPTPTAKWDDLSIKSMPELPQLDNMKTQLDLVLIALESLGKITSEAMIQAAHELNLEAIVADRVSLWRLRQSNPQRKRSGGRKKLDVEEARALVLIATYLAHRHQSQIRQAVSSWEYLAQQQQSPQQDPLLADYIDTFINIYHERMENSPSISSAVLMQVSLKLLLELLFYSGPQGHKRLWASLWQRS
jgi:hypothetical protein